MIWENFAPGTTVPIFDVTISEPPNAQYNVMVICQQWEGASDWPDYKLVETIDDFTWVNAFIGFLYMHIGIPPNLVGELVTAFMSFMATGDEAAFSGISFVPTGYQTIPTSPTNLLNSTVCPAGGIVNTYLLPTWPLPIATPMPSFSWEVVSLVLELLVEAGYDRAGRPFNVFD